MTPSCRLLYFQADGRCGQSVVGVLAFCLIVSGCASVDFDRALANTNEQAASFTQGQLVLARNNEQRGEMDKSAAEILSKRLSQSDAVRLTMVNSPALQAMLAQNWADAAKAAQRGRIPNPVFTFQRLHFADEREFERTLSFGLLDLLMLPQRYDMAQRQIAFQQLRLTGDVIDQITSVRQAWVKAVAAQQNLIYAKQVSAAAQASSELARRMQAAGNFTKLQRAREHAFYAEAATQWGVAQHNATATREELVRLLGLSESQAAALRLPDRLPDLPDSPRLAQEVSRAASKGRMDIQVAQAELAARSAAQSLNLVTSVTDIELGVRRDTAFDNAAGKSASIRGYEISLRLPVFDWGDNERDAMNAQTLAAANRLEATVRSAGSNLRESYSAYRTAFDISKHYRDEIVPLRKAMAEENVLRYNGMLIGVFELLADARDQVASVMAAIAAEQQFWLADAALQASIIGKPTMAMMTTVGAMASSGGGKAEH